MCILCVAIVGKSCASAESMEAKVCGSLNENLSDRVVEGKCWSISLAATVERNVKKLMPDLRFARPETNVGVPEESIKPTPWRFATLKSVADRIHDVFHFTFHRISGKNEIRYQRRRQIANENGRGGRERKNVTKKLMAIIALR